MFPISIWKSQYSACPGQGGGWVFCMGNDPGAEGLSGWDILNSTLYTLPLPGLKLNFLLAAYFKALGSGRLRTDSSAPGERERRQRADGASSTCLKHPRHCYGSLPLHGSCSSHTQPLSEGRERRPLSLALSDQFLHSFIFS